LSAMGALVLVTDGTVSNDRDVLVAHMFGDLLGRDEQLTPAFSRGRLSNTTARKHCCQPRK
jgi:hypothetical protein